MFTSSNIKRLAEGLGQFEVFRTQLIRTPEPSSQRKKQALENIDKILRATELSSDTLSVMQGITKLTEEAEERAKWLLANKDKIASEHKSEAKSADFISAKKLLCDANAEFKTIIERLSEKHKIPETYKQVMGPFLGSMNKLERALKEVGDDINAQHYANFILLLSETRARLKANMQALHTGVESVLKEAKGITQQLEAVEKQRQYTDSSVKLGFCRAGEADRVAHYGKSPAFDALRSVYTQEQQAALKELASMKQILMQKLERIAEQERQAEATQARRESAMRGDTPARSTWEGFMTFFNGGSSSSAGDSELAQIKRSNMDG